MPGPVINEHGHILITESAQWELNPHFRHGKAAGYRYIMGAKFITTKLSKIKNREHRAGIEPAYPARDGGILPLEDQCCGSF
jgi:hypothetical protein